MIVREADLKADAVQIMDGARNFSSRTAVKKLLPTDDNIFIKVVSSIVCLKNFELLVAEHNHRIVGGIGILYGPYIWNPERQTAEEIFWWTVEDAPYRTGYALVEEAMIRINLKGAVPIFRKLTTSPDGVGKIYNKFGLEQIETVFMRIF